MSKTKIASYLIPEIEEQFDLEKLDDPEKLLRFLLSGRNAEQIVAEIRRNPYGGRVRGKETYAGKCLVVALRTAIKSSQEILALFLPELMRKALVQVEAVLDDPRASRQDKLKAANLVVEMSKFLMAHQRKSESATAKGSNRIIDVTPADDVGEMEQPIRMM
jgi:hypothetical protein